MGSAKERNEETQGGRRESEGRAQDLQCSSMWNLWTVRLHLLRLLGGDHVALRFLVVRLTTVKQTASS